MAGVLGSLSSLAGGHHSSSVGVCPTSEIMQSDRAGRRGEPEPGPVSSLSCPDLKPETRVHRAWAGCTGARTQTGLSGRALAPPAARRRPYIKGRTALTVMRMYESLVRI